MDERHLCFAALAASPWLAIVGTASLACGLLLCGDPDRALAGGAALATGVMSGVLAWEQLWKLAEVARA
jgi:hypothetical protein